VVTNQAVIARGLLTEADVVNIHNKLQDLLMRDGGKSIDAYYFCPHHPNANLVEYRVSCDCRKPKAGLLLQAALDWEIDLEHSWMVGDRPSDILAGKRANCKTILVQSGMHLEPPIESEDNLTEVTPDFTCKNLIEAEQIINGGKRS
jgi:D-glycero-D-manno-heptose 1,7-bisphosphate phosphatase